MTSQPKTDAKLTETECVAIKIESRLVSLTAAVYFLIATVMFVGGALIAFAFPDEIQAQIQSLGAVTRKLAGWLLYLPPAAIAVGGYYLAVEHWLRRKLYPRPDFRL